jgi:hypothetical protein
MKYYHTLRSLGELKAEAERLTREQRHIAESRGYTKLFACKVDYDLSDKWDTRILCADCIAKFEPPARVKRMGDTGVYQCEDCGKYNQVFRRAHA